MNLRSGRSVEVAVPKELRLSGLSKITEPGNKFYAILYEDNNRWPNEEQACRLSTDTLNSATFTSHVRNLMSYMVEKDFKTKSEMKGNWLVLMAIARSLMNVAHDDIMRTKYSELADVVIRKFEEYNGPEVLEFPISEYVAEFKMMMR